MTYKLQVVIADNQTMDNIGYINYLTQHNMQVTYTKSLLQLKEVLLYSKVDILLFNLKQSDENGMAFLQSMGFQPTMGVIVFANEEESDQYALALEYGADDFICQLDDYDEVMTRILSLYRRLYKHKVSFPSV